MQAAATSPALSPVASEVSRIRALLERHQFLAALHAAEALAVTVPENRDVLYMMAVSRRYLKQLPEALADLERLERHHPNFSLLHQERGHCYVTMRDAPRAIGAFLKAVNINPALPASWRTLQSLYRMTGQAESAEMASGHLAALAKLPAEIITATALFSDGDLAPAEAIVRAYLLKHGNHIEGMRLLARIGLAHDVLDDADVLLEAVLELAPDYRAARYDYAIALLRRHKHEQCMAELEKLLQLEPNNRAFKTTYATAKVGLGDHEAALRLYQELIVDGAPPLQAAELHLSVAHSLKAMGRQPEAIESYRAAAAVRPSFGDAYWSLANLKTYRFAAEEISRMRAAEAAETTALVDRYHLCFALGKALEDLGEFAESFAYYERGNALKKSQSRYRPEPVERNTRLQKNICTAEFFASRRGVGCDSPDPIFIVGLPRSGSTLLEQILASHSKVEGTMELADIPRLVLDLQGREAETENPRYPGVLRDLAPAEFLNFGRKYLDDTRGYRTDKPYFVDKMPNNFRHLGLIHLILPNAKIIDARRNAMACCFSNFKQLFASGQEFTYSLEDIGRYYRTYVELMAHWDEVMPGRVLRVEHEDVVENLEANVRRILDFCGLEFEPGCVEFYKTERSIRTASSEQVRQPIFKEGIDQWRHFEPWLGPLVAALGSPAV
ncbi:MAG: tetratricopeptide repeat-containing sulfotransferase family protein [Steroidobacteraceae bacterium]